MAKYTTKQAQELLIRYQKNPQLELYIQLRREFPEIPIDMSVHKRSVGAVWGDLKRFKINPVLVLRALDGHPASISALAFQVLERISEARQRQRHGERSLVIRKLAIPDKLINWLVNAMLEGTARQNAATLSSDLVMLLRERNGGTAGYYYERASAAPMRDKALQLAGRAHAQGRTPNLREIASEIGVAASTVHRWFKDAKGHLAFDRVVSVKLISRIVLRN